MGTLLLRLVELVDVVTTGKLETTEGSGNSISVYYCWGDIIQFVMSCQLKVGLGPLPTNSEKCLRK